MSHPTPWEAKKAPHPMDRKNWSVFDNSGKLITGADEGTAKLIAAAPVMFESLLHIKDLLNHEPELYADVLASVDEALNLLK